MASISMVGGSVVLQMATGNFPSWPLSIQKFAHRASSLKQPASPSHAGSSLAPASNRSATAKKSVAVHGSSAVASDTKSATVRVQSCGHLPSPRVGLAQASTPELRSLSRYETVCKGAAFQRSSFFVPFPGTVTDARTSAEAVAQKLHEYACFGIRPVVFLEPSNEQGAVNLQAIGNGTYNDVLTSYYATLKAAGITDSMMGTWVIIPEANLPVWSSLQPEVFGAAYRTIAQHQKAAFPSSQTSLLLDSESYTTSSWGTGRYVSLVPYVRAIPKGLIDSVGLQGFPWASPANQTDNSLFSPAVYLRTDELRQLAEAVGTRKVWFNTGTFATAYTSNQAQMVHVAGAQRQQMLDGVMAEARTMKASGYSVSIHLFAQDKAATCEAIDWSYRSPDDMAVLRTFVSDATNAGVGLWLFDV